MKDANAFVRWTSFLAIATAALVLFGCAVAWQGAVVRLWLQPSFSMGQGLPNVPAFAMILFFMGLFGALISRDA
jgi:hypothetical protein